MKRKKITQQGTSTTLGKKGASTRKSSSKELKLSLPSEKCLMTDLATQGKTSLSFEKVVKLKKLAVKIENVTLRRGRSAGVDSDNSAACAEADKSNLNQFGRTETRSKLDHNESRVVAAEILNELIESNLKRSRKRSRDEQQSAMTHTRRGRSHSSELGGDLSISHCVQQLDSLTKKRSRRQGFGKTTLIESRPIVNDIVGQLIETCVKHAESGQERSDIGAGDMSNILLTVNQMDDCNRRGTNEDTPNTEDYGHLETPPSKKIKLNKEENVKENIEESSPVPESQEQEVNDASEPLGKGGDKLNIQEALIRKILEEGELDNSDDESDVLNQQSQCEANISEDIPVSVVSEELNLDTEDEVFSPVSPDILECEVEDDIEILDPITDTFDFDRTLRVTTRFNITSRNFDTLFLPSEDIESIYFGNFFFVTQKDSMKTNWNGVKKILKRRGFSYENYSTISNDLPTTAPKIQHKDSDCLFVTSKENVRFNMLKELRKFLPTLHLRFSKYCYIVCKSIDTAQNVHMLYMSGTPENFQNCSKLKLSYLNSRQVAKILQEKPEISTTLSVIWKRKRDRSENW